MYVSHIFVWAEESVFHHSKWYQALLAVYFVKSNTVQLILATDHVSVFQPLSVAFKVIVYSCSQVFQFIA